MSPFSAGRSALDQVDHPQRLGVEILRQIETRQLETRDIDLRRGHGGDVMV